MTAPQTALPSAAPVAEGSAPALRDLADRWDAWATEARTLARQMDRDDNRMTAEHQRGQAAGVAGAAIALRAALAEQNETERP